jgi:acetylornithine deacetylase/succinyl-diaminopimelate desuccinylase-like protein
MSGSAVSGATPLLESVRKFAFPRFPGTEGEKRAADLFAEELTRCGWSVTRQPFRTSLSAMHRIRVLALGLVAALAILIGMTEPFVPLFACVAGVVLLLLLTRSSRWPRFFEAWYDDAPLVDSQNVHGRRSSEPARVILLAHLDSKSSRDSTFVAVTLILAAGLVTAYLVLRAALAVLGIADPAPLHWTFPLSLGIAAAMVRALWNPSGNLSPGAMDNASGLAVLLEAARAFPHDSEISCERVQILATGSEEIGLAGALRWIQAYERDLDRAAVFVNLDSVGVGRGLLAVDVHGDANAGVAMNHVVRHAARSANVELNMVPGIPGTGVDTMPIAARGFATVTFLGQVLGKPAQRLHTPGDTAEHLNEEALRDAVRMVRELIRGLLQGERRPDS